MCWVVLLGLGLSARHAHTPASLEPAAREGCREEQAPQRKALLSASRAGCGAVQLWCWLAHGPGSNDWCVWPLVPPHLEGHTLATDGSVVRLKSETECPELSAVSFHQSNLSIPWWSLSSPFVTWKGEAEGSGLMGESGAALSSDEAVAPGLSGGRSRVWCRAVLCFFAWAVC